MKNKDNKILTSIYNLLDNSASKYNSQYNGFMLIVILLSLVSLVFKTNYLFINYLDYFTVTVFIIDYILRLITANNKLKKGFKSFLIYPFTPWALIDLLSILPSFSILSHGFKIFRALRITKLLRGLRIIKIFRVSKDIQLLVSVLQREKNSLTSFGILVLGYIFITALVMFNVEPETFNTFFDAIYWATVSLTTVGYGDIYATSVMGKIITMVSSLFGIALIAMPASIITTGLLEEVNNKK
jgi:voltage-gated potassium channel